MSNYILELRGADCQRAEIPSRQFLHYVFAMRGVGLSLFPET